ncbi:MAG: transcription elongation factor Spt5 [Candidatus Hodarchaeales archaeon]|jgi:transcriptional antiterminator NusG
MVYIAIYSVRTGIGREKDVAEMLAEKARFHKLVIKAILVVDALRGYLFIEGDRHDVEKVVSEVPQFRCKVIGKVPVEQLEEHLIPKSIIADLGINDIVEIISGPFKDNRAKISAITPAREEVTLIMEGQEIAIPIVTHVDNIRILESAKKKITQLEEDARREEDEISL